MKILAIGEVSYIGNHIVKVLLKKGGHDIAVIDNLCQGLVKAIDSFKIVGEFEFLQTNLENIAKMDKVFKFNKFDTNIRFAAFIKVFENMGNFLKYHLNNTTNAICAVLWSVSVGFVGFLAVDFVKRTSEYFGSGVSFGLIFFAFLLVCLWLYFEKNTKKQKNANFSE